MPRSLRIEFPGAFYHVMARGNRRETIFHDDDRRFFLANPHFPALRSDPMALSGAPAESKFLATAIDAIAPGAKKKHAEG